MMCSFDHTTRILSINSDVSVSGQMPFASCYVCGKQGHISKACPDNPRGLYPFGENSFLSLKTDHFSLFVFVVWGWICLLEYEIIWVGEMISVMVLVVQAIDVSLAEQIHQVCSTVNPQRRETLVGHSNLDV